MIINTCRACRRELIVRDKNDRPEWFWDSKNYEWFLKPVAPPEPYFTTKRRGFRLVGLHPITGWLCQCGYLNEINASTLHQKDKTTKLQIIPMDRSSSLNGQDDRSHRGSRK